jgi:glycosyltransferase involved in cell wall biosynthesis
MTKRAVFIDSEQESVSGGGIRTYIKTVVPILQMAGWDTLVFTHTPDAYPNIKVEKIQRLAWPNRPFRRLWYFCAYQQTVSFGISMWLLKRLKKIDTPETKYEFCDYDGLAFHSLRDPTLKAKLTIRIHTPLYLIPSDSHKDPRTSIQLRIEKTILKWRETYCLNHAKHLTTPSPHFKNRYLPEIPQAKALFNPPPKVNSQASLRSGERLKPDFLFLGRIEKRKGILEMLEAFHLLRQEYPQIRLTLAGGLGDSDYSKLIRSWIDSHQGTQDKWLSLEPIFVGDKELLFSRFSVLLVPSLWENAPYVFYEAMVHGVIALGSDTGDMAIAQKETHGFLPAGGSIPQWNHALVQLWENREAAPSWRNKQWAWINKRREEAQIKFPEYWSSL